jgi:hypothetical protein
MVMSRNQSFYIWFTSAGLHFLQAGMSKPATFLYCKYSTVCTSKVRLESFVPSSNVVLQERPAPPSSTVQINVGFRAKLVRARGKKWPRAGSKTRRAAMLAYNWLRPGKETTELGGFTKPQNTGWGFPTKNSLFRGSYFKNP